MVLLFVLKVELLILYDINVMWTMYGYWDILIPLCHKLIIIQIITYIVILL